MPAPEPASHRTCGNRTHHATQRHGISRWLQRHLPRYQRQSEPAQTTLAHAPDSSFYYITVGRLKNIDEIKHMALALPQSATCVGTANRHRTATRHQTIRRFHPGNRRKPQRPPNHHGGTGMSTNTDNFTHNTNTGAHQAAPPDWQDLHRNRHRLMGRLHTPSSGCHADGKSPGTPNYLRRTRTRNTQACSSQPYSPSPPPATSSTSTDRPHPGRSPPSPPPSSDLSWRSQVTVPALRLWWQMLFMVVAQLVVGPGLFLNDTTIAHIVPTLRTLTQGWMNDARMVQYRWPSNLLPVPPMAVCWPYGPSACGSRY